MIMKWLLLEGDPLAPVLCLDLRSVLWESRFGLVLALGAQGFGQVRLKVNKCPVDLTEYRRVVPAGHLEI